MWIIATACWPSLQTTWPTGYNGSWMQQCDLFRILASLTGVYCLCCTTICTGSTFQSIHQLQTELYCASQTAGESSEIPGRLLHASFGSRRPSTTTLSKSTTPDCRLTGRTRSDARPFRSPWSKTCVLPGFEKNYLKRNYLRVTKHTKRSSDASWFCAI